MPPHQQDPDQQRNFIVAMVLMVAFVWAYQAFVIEPERQAREAARAAEATRAAATAPLQVDTAAPAAPAIAPSVEAALGTAARLPFDGPSVDGSINLSGARIDDLQLKRHFLTVERERELRLMRPENAPFGYYAAYGWLPEAGAPLVGVDTEWQVVDDASRLTPQTPVTLRAERQGLVFERTVSLDENYMFTFTDQVTNTGGTPRALTPFGVIRRYGDYEDFLDATDPGSARDSAIVHQGLIGVFDRRLSLRKYNGLAKDRGIKGDATAQQSGWVGFTDKYWMGALVPEPGRGFQAEFSLRERADEPLFELLARADAVAIQPGETISVQNRVFAGAKRLAVLRDYEETLGVPRFDDAIDWGMFYFLTKPFFQVLVWLQGLVGSFGWAILAFTVLLKLPLVPLYNQSYKAMAKMKLLQEPMKEINERFAGDPKRKQQEIMKLYQREKANPLAGCLPILATIPIFYALYKTLFVTIEMRHESFGYIRDLSAPDPTAIGNLFGLIPWAASDVKAIPILGLIIGIGILPILYGLTMWALQSLSPPPPDKTQRTIMMMLPVILTFVFAGFAAGLVLYWVWNNVLSLIQQYFIMRRNGVETQFDKLVARLLGGKKTEAS